ncbi:polymorphic toxin type 33 domain-containing protein [Flavobacterium sp. I-SCBP12n]|uniref:Polymorphic toxin type 33 domain-containing protein n=1 Tax=Flavobacterium pygoscelis TaxID=2893176 RepID=A0A9X1XY50_9FLAO|nr:SpvB/TcaC N-terminal domain-containing protein [Flavobacterium pygoscelis]MCK8141822.1 polymorphic toxin type 33 domain-containing protein [Flavobacterium pygoscelis]
MKNKIIISVLLVSSFLFAINLKNNAVVSLLTTHFFEEQSTESLPEKVKLDPAFVTPSKVFDADIQLGVIGIQEENDSDDAYDNVFHFKIDAEPAATESAYLEYELYGFDQAASISRSVNNQPSIGGQFLSPNKSWNQQSELLSEKSLRNGDNVVLFTASEGVANSYKIKNVRIVYKSVVPSNELTLLQSETKLYIKGTNFPSQIKSLTIEGIAIDMSEPEFELVLDRKEAEKSILLTKETTTGTISNQNLAVSDFKKVDRFVAVENAKERIFKTIDFQKESKMVYKDFSAIFPIGALKNKVTVSVSGLRKIDIAPLNTAMVNVTKTNAGFRLLPHGTVFEKAVHLSLPFDKKAIPEGYTEKDINVFYFDENKRLWQEVRKDSLDIKGGMISAKTTHFTDFIAGIIKMPESPETSGYTPTSIKDLKAASPLVGIQSIAPPSANGRGTASTGFGIAIPNGRGGMQPSFNLQYDSDGGHSWAGMGWDVSVPSVNIETRWGAPRYDANQETESYSIAGEALIPNTHRAAWVTRTADKQFYPRREGAFQKIIRKGSSPKDYYWIVRDKSGVASYYGGTTSGLADNSILQDASGNIGHWALAMQVDLKGNTVQYEYEKKEGELYLKKVYYTGFGSEKGNYSVSFVKNSDLGEPNRPDVQVSARLGFKQLNNQLLRKIEVRYKDQMVRSYELNYKEGAFKKTLLKSISEFDSESKLFYTNTLDYFDDVREAGVYKPFGEEQVWTVPNNNIKQGFTGIKFFESNHTLVGSTIGNSKGINYRIGVGPSSAGYKNNTIGAHGGNNWGESETFVVLQDLDGDGYPDKVFSKGNVVYYCKNLMATVPFNFDIPKIITGINDLGVSKSKSFSWGVDASIGNGVTSANIGYDEQRSTNRSISYFMDFNGDGLVDFVENGKVQYNRIVDGVPTFLTSSLATPAPVSGIGTLTLTAPDRTVELDELLKKNPLNDVVRVWQAPVNGTIAVNQSYQLLEDTSKQRQDYKTRNGIDKADGVHLYFQKNNDLIWDEVISGTDYTIKTRPAQTLTVTKGERLYFRVSSIKDGNFDKVSWDPKIEYIKVREYYYENNSVKNRLNDVLTTDNDANLVSLKNFQASEDFFVSSSNPIVVPKSGIINFSGTLKKPFTSDHVTLKIVKNVMGSNVETILYKKTFLASEIVNFDLTSLSFNIPEDNAFIRTQVETLTNIDVKTLELNAIVTIPAMPGTKPEDNIKKVDVSHSFYSKIDGNYVINGEKPTITGKLVISINPLDYQLIEQPLASDYNGKIIISAKQANKLVARKTFDVVDGKLEETTSVFDNTYVYPETQQDQPIDLEVYVSNTKLNEIIKSYPNGKLKINYKIEIPIEEAPYVLRWVASTDNFSIFSDWNETDANFGIQYKNWGRFAINGNLAGNLINQSQLKFNSNNNIDTDNFPDINSLDPDSMPEEFNTNNQYFIPMAAKYSDTFFYGGEENIFIQREFMGTSRLGEDDFAEYADFSSPVTSITGGETEALDMITESKSRSIGGGGGIGVGSGAISGGLSASKGDSYVVQTMSDMNGDRYPDYIRDGKVQFTTPMGGKENRLQDTGNFSHSKTTSLGGSASGSYSHGGTQSSASVDISKTGVKFNSAKTNAGSNAAKVGGTVSLGGNIGFSNDHSTHIYSDINGDGLADKIQDNESVALNTGYGFLPSETWPNMNVINKGKSLDIAGNAGYSIYNGSFSGGLNYSHTTSDNSNSFLDINSDGLADKITYHDNAVLVELNMGNSFAPAITYPRYESMTRNTSSSYGGNVGFSIPINVWLLKIVPSFGASIGTSTSRTEATFNDIDGDGNLDYILSTDEDNLTVRLSNIKRTNKLKGVTNAAGNSYVVDYELLKPTYENPNGKWVLQSVDINDGHVGDGIDHSIAKFRYEDGYYDRREREFYGFGKVIQEQIDAADNSVFATTTQEFYNQDYFRKNLLKRSYTLDKNNKMRQESENEYSFIEVDTQASVSLTDLSSAVCDAKRIFVGLIHTNQKMYEGGSEYLETNTFSTYDANGNITQYDDLGNGTTTDKVTAKITYHESATPYFGGIPKQLEVFTKDGLRRKRATTINTTTAEVTQIKNYSAADKIAITDIAYDAYGNLQKITGPANYKDQRMTMNYVYDGENHSFLTEIKDAFGYQNKMEYDYRFGIPLKTTDRNDQSTEYTIDAVGRPKTIRGPYEIASGKPYTIAYDYFPTAKVPYAKTRNYDPELDKDIETYTYTDGLGRALQVKKTASLFTAAGSPDQEAHIVSGKVIYDGLGRPTTSYYPTTTTTIDAAFSTALSSVNPTKTEYDEVGRAIKVTLPDGSNNTTTFKIDTFEGVSTMLTTQTDALNKTVQSQTDVKGSNLASIQNDLVTKFDINALGETIQVTDAMDHITKSTYDWLGRRTEFTHPDAGTTAMEYDLAGNLTKRVTQDIKNTVPNGGAIQYEYDYNRLESIKYPKNPQNNVQYNYGKANGTAPRRGRLWFVKDASGGQEFFYGKLGEVEKEIRTLRITPTDVQTYISQFEYDTWNRIQKMTYPDGEVVDYTYNRAGNLQSMQGKKESHTYDYIKQLAYDEFEQRKYLKYGNDTETNYTYDPTMRRLQQLQVKSGARQVMNNSYGYDLVGNVLNIKNTAPIINNTLGGTSNHEYQYDDFYRLKTAKALYNGEFTEAKYELNMSYNKMHNITNKNLVHTVNNEQKGYVLDYNYDNELHPNAPNKIVEVGKAEPRVYVYDGNGNPTSYSEEKSFRKMTWDEENRLMGINDNGRIHQYTYDAGGERVIKSSGDSQNVAINGQTAATIVHTDDYTGYVSPYFVISKGKFTKHYFEGAGRIVSKLGNGAFAQPLGITAGGVNYTNLTAEQQKAMDAYVKSLGLPPGPPTQQGIYATPEFTGNPYPSEVLKPAAENQAPPEGWPRNPIFNKPGDVPGPPVQFGPPVEPTTVKPGEGFTGIGLPENDIFYFHPDHLGSTSYITTRNGSISQHVEYIAFGEVLFEEHSSSFSSPYLFNGKELDRETNLSYYGARYLDMKTSLWLSVDPLATYNPVFESEFYFDGQHNGGIYNSGNLNPYIYCYQNPISYIDPNGKQVEWGKYWNKTKQFLDDSGEVINKVAENLAPVRPMKKEEVSAFESRYGKNDGNPIHDLQRSATALSDVPGDILESLESLSWKGFKDKFNNASVKEKAEMALTAGVIILSLKKGKIDTKDIAMMGSAGKNFKILTANLLKKAGIDAHELKYEFLGKKAKISEYDLYKHTDTNEVLILKKGGKGEPIHTGEFITE